MSIVKNTNDEILEEKLRLRIIEKAEEVRFRWSRKGLFDIFEILENECILIVKPMNSKDISGFTTFFENNYIVVINSSFTLGHQRFTAAHELAHLVLHNDLLQRDSILFNDKNIEREATQFAIEFLMPEQGVKEIFHKIINVKSSEINVRHVIVMHQYFKVSYKAMLKRLVFLNLCDENLYPKLKEYCTLENEDKLIKLTKNDGYKCDLISKNYTKYVSKEYEEIIRRNYETGKISYKRLEYLLSFIDRTPQEYGYMIDEDK